MGGVAEMSSADRIDKFMDSFGDGKVPVIEEEDKNTLDLIEDDIERSHSEQSEQEKSESHEKSAEVAEDKNLPNSNDQSVEDVELLDFDALRICIEKVRVMKAGSSAGWPDFYS